MMRPRPGVLLRLAIAALALGAGACGATEERVGDAAPGAGAWRAVPPGPLSAREGGLALWTGREVLVMGGSDAPPCPPSASCAVPEVPPLADGAAFDPRTRRWRQIADAPVPFDGAQGVVVGSAAYLWIPGTEGRPGADAAFLAYDVGTDRWRRLPRPPDSDGNDLAIVRAGGLIVAYRGSDEQGERPDEAFDPATATWSALPPDPTSPSFGRSMAWSGRELVLFDQALVPNPGSEEPSLTRASALDPDTGSWRRLPDSEILGTGPWLADGDRLINPTLGGADGGEVGGWGRTYPNGGILDPEREAWRGLPDPPGEAAGQDAFTAGVVGRSGSLYSGVHGWVLDAATGTWVQLPPLPRDADATGRTVVAAGDDLFTFGGARWDDRGTDATLLADAWTWSPPEFGISAPRG